jgi:hypothetical protein
MNMRKTIEQHWDPDGSIPSDADPREEYELWRDFARTHPKDWNGSEFTLQDFREYVRGVIEFGRYD